MATWEQDGSTPSNGATRIACGSCRGSSNVGRIPPRTRAFQGNRTVAESVGVRHWLALGGGGVGAIDASVLGAAARARAGSPGCATKSCTPLPIHGPKCTLRYDAVESTERHGKPNLLL